jgi:REP element-mobilizing transposase RayT
MPYDPQKHHRRSIRLQGYDYTRAGAYFVTLVTHDRACLFGNVVNGVMQLNPWGNIAAQTWEWLATQYPYVDLDAWVIMPNHVHGILVITNAPVGARRDALPGHHDAPGPGPSAPVPTRRKPLGQLIGAFKTVSAKHINLSRATPGLPVWQRNYYEHIIRDTVALARIRQYIANNPLKWALGAENPTPSQRHAP